MFHQGLLRGNLTTRGNKGVRVRGVEQHVFTTIRFGTQGFRRLAFYVNIWDHGFHALLFGVQRNVCHHTRTHSGQDHLHTKTSFLFLLTTRSTQRGTGTFFSVGHTTTL